jgi:hypothetical protein
MLWVVFVGKPSQTDLTLNKEPSVDKKFAWFNGILL